MKKLFVLFLISGVVADVAAQTSWLLTGNAGITSSTNFIGTTDNQPLSFRVNNLNAGKVTSTGFVSLGYEANNIADATNTAIGHQTFKTIGAGTDWSTGVGYQAGYSTTSGWNSTYFGFKAGFSNTTSKNNAAFGAIALLNSTGSQNTAIGNFSLKENTTGQSNTAIGFLSGSDDDNLSANYKTVVDNCATFVGYKASRDAIVSNTISPQILRQLGKMQKLEHQTALFLGEQGPIKLTLVLEYQYQLKH